MWNAFTAINEALNATGIPATAFCELAPGESTRILRELKTRFCGGADPTWWWEHYANALSWRPEVGGFTLLPRLCPDEYVLFIPHGENVEHVYLSTPHRISQVLGECPAFEYSVAGQELDWLLTETHHDELVAVGERLTRKLAEVRDADRATAGQPAAG